MLNLTRKQNESVIIDGDIKITVLRDKHGQVKRLKHPKKWGIKLNGIDTTWADCSTIPGKMVVLSCRYSLV
jgi:hypothetical protein